jgi:hypothetical protein
LGILPETPQHLSSFLHKQKLLAGENQAKIGEIHSSNCGFVEQLVIGSHEQAKKTSFPSKKEWRTAEKGDIAIENGCEIP